MLAGKYLKAKAAESHGLLGFVVDRLQKHANVLSLSEHDFLLRAGKAAMDFDAVMANRPRAIDERTCGMLFDHDNRFICLCNRAGLALLRSVHRRTWALSVYEKLAMMDSLQQQWLDDE